MKLIDSHAHMDSEQFDSDRAEVFQRIKDNMDFIVNIGYDIESSKQGVEYSKNMTLYMLLWEYILMI